MSDRSDEVDDEERAVRIDRARRESAKFIAEQQKLTAESIKFHYEAMKLERERMTILITAIAAMAAVIGAAVTWVAGHLPPAH